MKRIAIPLFATILLVLAACSSPAATPSATPTPTAGTEPTTGPAGGPLYLDSAQPVDARVADLLSRMTLEEKIGQMTQVSVEGLSPRVVANAFLGSVFSGGSGIPANNTPAGWVTIISAYQKAALSTRLAIPILYGIDAVHGIGHLAGATVFPHEIGLGAAHDPELVRQIGQATAEEMLALGLNWNFAPVVAVPQDIRWGRTYEGYGEDAALVSELGAAYIDGLQSIPAGVTAAPGQILGVLATAKHYVGDGATVWDPSRQSSGNGQYFLDQGDARMDETVLRLRFLPPYQAAVDSGVMSVMASYSSWNGVRMHANTDLLTGVLKGEMGFQGFIVSDSNAIPQIDPGNAYLSVVTAVNAGVDMDMTSGDYYGFMKNIKQGLADGDISLKRIDDAVARILRVKFALGLFEHPYAWTDLQSAIRSPEHLALAVRAVHESLVLLKNENGALPVAKDAPVILVGGIGADSTGRQSGGWTLGWQGTDGNEVIGTTILDGIRAQAGAGTQVMYRSSGVFADLAGNAPVGIAVVSEAPYAEGIGDKADLTISQADQDMIAALRQKVDRLIVVIVSGRPLVITGQYLEADAWVAAWLPGSEGAAVADALFGKTPFTGTTPYTWPRSNDQLPMNINNAEGKTGCDGPLFPEGYGLGEAGGTPIAWIECP